MTVFSIQWTTCEGGSLFLGFVWVVVDMGWQWMAYSSLVAVSLIMQNQTRKEFALLLSISRSLRPLSGLSAVEVCREGTMFSKILHLSKAVSVLSPVSPRLHWGFEGRTATAGNLAFPFSPSDHQLDGKILSLFLNPLHPFAWFCMQESSWIKTLHIDSKIA